MTRLRRMREAREGGFTLTELLISMALFSLLMAITFSILITVMYQSKDTLAQQEAIRQAQLGIAQIDRQVRSGNVIHNPILETVAESGVPPFYSMRIFTQENGVPRCVQWRIIDHDGSGYGDLEFRTWHPQWPTVPDVTPWSVVARGMVDVGIHPASVAEIDPDDPATHPPFWVADTLMGDAEAQSVNITLRLKSPDARESAKPIPMTTVVTGRNTVFNHPPSSCQQVPSP